MNITLTPGELRQVTGGLAAARRQLHELHRRGFWRARMGTDGKVVLERAHYDAVCAGALPPGTVKSENPGPQLRSLRKVA